MRKRDLSYKFVFRFLSTVILFVLGGCGLQSPPQEIVTLYLPRSEVRDAVRNGAKLATGEPLLARIENDYGFDGDRFQLDGVANAVDGATSATHLELTVAQRDDALRFELADHDLQLGADEIERLNEAISAELMRSIAATLSREIHGYDAVQISDNNLEVTLRIEPMEGVVPLNP